LQQIAWPQNHRRAAAQPCVNGDWLSKGRMAKFGHSSFLAHLVYSLLQRKHVTITSFNFHRPNKAKCMVDSLALLTD